MVRRRSTFTAGTLTNKTVKTAKRIRDGWPRRPWIVWMSATRPSTTCYTLSTLAASSRVMWRTRQMSVTAWTSRSRRSSFGSLSHQWSDHCLSRATKLRLFRLSLCSNRTHSCEASSLTRTVARMIKGFNSRCLHAITGEDYRTAQQLHVPAYNLVLALCKAPAQARLRYLGHVLLLPTRREHATLPVGLCEGRHALPESSLLSDCDAGLPLLEALLLDCSAWRAKVPSLTLILYNIPGPGGLLEQQRRGSVGLVVSTSAWHTAGQGFDSRTRHVSFILGVKTWLSTL